MPSSVSAILWLFVVARLQAVSASCLNNVQHDTVGFFSGAPITFGYDYATASDCASMCNQLEKCRAWLYAVPGDCQLYSRTALATASAPNFFYGVCGSPVATASASRPAASKSVSVAPASPSPVIADNSSHEMKLQRHKRHAYNHHGHGH